MAAHAEAADVQSEAADALANLAGSDAGKEEVLGAGGLEALQAAAALHPTCESVTDLLKVLAEIKRQKPSVEVQ